MRQDGWHEKRSVSVHEGRWQDVVSQLAEQGCVFDAIYFDTFAEEYKALKTFFQDYVITLLEQEGPTALSLRRQHRKPLTTSSM